MLDLKAAEWAIVFATIVGPILAVQAQKFVERAREKRGGRKHLFYTLMETRAARVSADHVRALNMIDLEFYGRRLFGQRFQSPAEKKVIAAWRTYQDHLNQPVDQKGESPEGIRRWVEHGDEQFTELLFEISNALGFDFDKVQLRRGTYYPRAHDENERAYLAIREGLVRLLNGTAPLKMDVTSLPVADEDLARSRRVQESLLEALSGNRSIKVAINGDDRPAV